jgi:hypothetical protein
MGIFARKASRNIQLADELATLRESIRNRGQAQIPEATVALDSFVSHVLVQAGAANNDQARFWVLDRIRFFIVAVLSPQLFDLLKDFPEFPQLEAEYQVLVTNSERYGAAHLVAWWWLLQRSLFEPLLQEQFRQMEGALVERTCGILTTDGDFRGQLVDWNNVFRS